MHFKYQNLNYKIQKDGVQTDVGNKHFAKDSFKPAGNKSEIRGFFYSRFENLSSKLAYTSKSSRPLPEATYEYLISKKGSLGDCVCVFPELSRWERLHSGGEARMAETFLSNFFHLPWAFLSSFLLTAVPRFEHMFHSVKLPSNKDSRSF